MKIGVLALQGDFIEHVKMFERLGQKAVEIRLPRQLQGINGLLIPGGESTTMMNLMQSFDLIEPIRKLAERSCCHLGHLRRPDMRGQKSTQSRFHAHGDAGIDEYHRYAQCLRQTGGQL